MATKTKTRKATRKTATEGQKKVALKAMMPLPKTTEQLLKQLHETFDFGPVLNGLIKTALTVDPFKVWPKFLGEGMHGWNGPVERDYTATDGMIIIRLGQAHGWEASLQHFPKTKQTLLVVGCRKFWKQSLAREHWVNNLNRKGHPRPNATELLDYVDRVCRHKGWTW